MPGALGQEQVVRRSAPGRRRYDPMNPTKGRGVPAADAWTCEPGGPRRWVVLLGRLGQAHVDGLETLGSFLKIELDRLTLFE